MGEVASSGRKQATFTLTNPGTQTVELTRIDSSCPCLKMDVPTHLAPGEHVEGRVNLDLRDEPDFMGELAIEVTGRTNTGESAFLVVVNVRVPCASKR